MAHIVWTILVPLKDNDGHVFSPEHHDAFRARARELFGGYTSLGLTFGEWTDASGAVYADDCSRYEIATPSLLDSARVRSFCDFAAKHYRQKAIYVSALGVVDLYEPNWRTLV